MIGKALGHYLVLEKIGEGGMGVVWKALDQRLGRKVAIKTLFDDVAGDADRISRFEKEARNLAALNHPNKRFDANE
jgi:serine/threonine protein kinase